MESRRSGRLLPPLLLKRVVILVASGVATLVAILGYFPSHQRVGTREVPVAVQRALLAADWPQVLKLLHSDGTIPASPVRRLIKAHACLVLNRNNESLSLFRQASAPAELEKWCTWNRYFAQTHPTNATAQYLYSDALARAGKGQEAVSCLSRSLQRHPNDAPSLNARAVLYARQHQWDEAVVDFVAATQANPSLADAYAGRGAMYLEKQDGASGALTAFDRALVLSPNFGLALVGRGCARFIGGDARAASTDFKRAAAFECVRGVVEENLKTILGKSSGGKKILAVLSEQRQYAMQVESSLQAFKKNPNATTARALAASLEAARDPATANRAATELTTWLGQNPKSTQLVKSALEQAQAAAQPAPARDLWGNIVVDARAKIDKSGPDGSLGISLNKTIGGSPDGPSAGEKAQLGLLAGAVERFGPRTADGGGQYKGPGTTPPGGVSTSGLKSAPVDAGHWGLTTPYGLLLDAGPPALAVR